MVSKRVSAWVLLLAVLLLPGCVVPVQTESPAETAVGGAVAILEAYLGARRENQIGQAYEFLSAEAQAAFALDEMVDHYQGITNFEWSRLGEPKLMREEWVRVVAYDVTANLADGSPSHELQHAYYLHFAAGKWGVALTNPLARRVRSLSTAENTDAQEIYAVTRLMLQVNPWNYSAFVHQYQLFLGVGDPAAAADALEQMATVALPPDMPDVHRYRAELLIELNGSFPEARESLALALELSQQYPQRYSPSWQARTLLVSARAARAMEDHDAAKEAALRAAELDPQSRWARGVSGPVRHTHTRIGVEPMNMFGRFSVPEIPAAEVKQRLEQGEKLVIVDIREPFEWQQTGVIPGAQLISMGDFARSRFEEFGPDDEIILVCASGVRTADVAAALTKRGWKAAKSMEGGMSVWTGERVPAP